MFCIRSIGLDHMDNIKQFLYRFKINAGYAHFVIPCPCYVGSMSLFERNSQIGIAITSLHEVEKTN